jgi:prepilin-type processing-associated H-X9-DG protein
VTELAEVGPYTFQATAANRPCDAFKFRSRHGSGANFLLADGSARFVAHAADSVLAKLGTRAGREVASLPDD